MLLLVMATIRALFLHLLRSPLREARELACAIAVAGLFATSVAIIEINPPRWMAQFLTQCKDSHGPIAVGSTISPIHEGHREALERRH